MAVKNCATIVMSMWDDFIANVRVHVGESTSVGKTNEQMLHIAN